MVIHCLVEEYLMKYLGLVADTDDVQSKCSSNELITYGIGSWI